MTLNSDLDFELQTVEIRDLFTPHQIIEVFQATPVGQFSDVSSSCKWELVTSAGTFYTCSGLPIFVGSYDADSSAVGIYITQYNFNYGSSPLYAIHSIPKYEEGASVDMKTKFRNLIDNIETSFSNHYDTNERSYITVPVSIAFPFTNDGSFNIPKLACGFDATDKENISYFVINKDGGSFIIDCYWWHGEDYFSTTDSRQFLVVIDSETNAVTGYRIVYLSVEEEDTDENQNVTLVNNVSADKVDIYKDPSIFFTFFYCLGKTHQ